MLWGLQSCLTKVSSERMWHFYWGSRHPPTSPVYFQGVRTPSTPHDIRPWLRGSNGDSRRLCKSRCWFKYRPNHLLVVTILVTECMTDVWVQAARASPRTNTSRHEQKTLEETAKHPAIRQTMTVDDHSEVSSAGKWPTIMENKIWHPGLHMGYGLLMLLQ